MDPVFVYGTLKKNQPNHSVLNDANNGRAVFRSAAVTTEKYPLVISTKYNIPFLLRRESVGHEIRGELYDVDAKMLRYLDDFENHPNFYVRRHTEVKLSTGDVVECWVYFLENFPDGFLELQRFDDYDSYGDHGLVYVTSEDVELLESALRDS